MGYDLTEGAWFHRELPVDGEKVLSRHPRLRGAKALVDSDGLRRSADGSWTVRGTEQDHVVRGDGPDDLHCTCPWADSHASGRGPCKHVLAVVLSDARPPGPRGSAPAGPVRRR